MPASSLDNHELLQLIRTHSRAGAEALYDQYAKLLRFAIFRIVREKELTDTILEKTFFQIWENAGHYNEQDLPLITWMLVIAKRLAREHIVINIDPAGKFKDQQHL